MMRRQAEAGGTKIRVLIIAVLLVSFVAYQSLIPIDDPSLDGPDNAVTYQQMPTNWVKFRLYVQYRGRASGFLG